FALQPTTINAAITITTTNEDVLPEAAILNLDIADNHYELSVKEFILTTKEPYNLAYGTLKTINYEGMGYQEEHTYTLTLTQLGFQPNLPPGTYTLTTTISYQDKIISTHEEKIIIP
ncbi:MAG: hypothetical protein Q7R56_00030, partial [Nanoarchaeota archaeon]|nr:hypothetical protein [Nanoarchaeota archaeon]